MKIVAYYRTSVEKSGESGMDQFAQQEAVRAFASQKDAAIIGQYSELATVESADRPELLKALAHASRSNATIVVASLDRLARSVRLVSSLMQSGADFATCDS